LRPIDGHASISSFTIARFSAVSVQSKKDVAVTFKQKVYFCVIEVDNKHLHRFVGSHMLLRDL